MRDVNRGNPHLWNIPHRRQPANGGGGCDRWYCGRRLRRRHRLGDRRAVITSGRFSDKMATNWLRDRRIVMDAGGSGTNPRVSAGVVQCLLEEVDNRLLLRRGNRAVGRAFDGSDDGVAIITVMEQDQSTATLPPDYSWLTSAWSPSMTSVSGRGARDISCRERWELEQLFREVKAHQCCHVIREFRKKAMTSMSAQEVIALMKDIVRATLLRQQEQDEANKMKKTSSNNGRTITAVKTLDRGTMATSGGGGSAFLSSRVRSMAYALVHPSNSHKIAPDADAFPLPVTACDGRRFPFWNDV